MLKNVTKILGSVRKTMFHESHLTSLHQTPAIKLAPTPLTTFWRPISTGSSLSEARDFFVGKKYKDAARIYVDWFDKEDIFSKSPEDLDSSGVTKHLPYALRAFLAFDCDDKCKDHIEHLALKIAMSPSLFIRGNSVLHLIASVVTEKSQRSIDTYAKLINLFLDTPEKLKEAIASKNSLGQNFIDVAVLYKNENFIIALKDKGKIPNDLPMDNILFYSAIEEEGADLSIYKELGLDIIGSDHHLTKLA